MAEHLWEVEHDYYGPEGSYWANGDKQRAYINEFASWADFVEGESMYSALKGLNLLYRWDWHDWREDHAKYGNEEGSPDFQLELFWMMPRKGIMARSTIAVTPDDEDAVRAWLEPHAIYMAKLWSPMIAVPQSDDVRGEQ